MVTRSCRAGVWLVLLSCIVCAALTIVVRPAQVQSAGPNLPPRPATPTVAPQPTVQPAPKPERESEPRGAFIELHVRSTAGLSVSHWRELWTVVQWQDDQGGWHDVEGWRGGLDGIQGGAGRKTWWLADNLFGHGPFRWLVRQVEADSSLTVSEAFYLPQAAGETKRVEVLLTP